jgi:hypothetical protein
MLLLSEAPRGSVASIEMHVSGLPAVPVAMTRSVASAAVLDQSKFTIPCCLWEGSKHHTVHSHRSRHYYKRRLI